MKNIILIAKREYLTQVKKKLFFIITVLTPLMIIVFGGFIGYIFQANKTGYTINVVDNSGFFNGKLQSTDNIHYIFAPSDSLGRLKSELRNSTHTDGVLVVPNLHHNDFEKLEKNTKLYTNKNISYQYQKDISEDLAKIIRHEKIKVLNINEDAVKDLNKSFTPEFINVVNENNIDTGLSFGVKSALGFVLMYAVFMFIVIYGVRVMRSVLEEKNNNVVEIIISSVKPFELMMGKILGVTGVALTQFSIWIVMVLGGTLFLNHKFIYSSQSLPVQSPEVMDMANITSKIGEVSQILLDMNIPLIIVVFVLFFLLGYIFYTSIYAAIGSAVDNETETQQFTIIALLPLMIAVYGSFSIIDNPNGPMAFWMSVIPFTSPVTMVARIPFGIQVWEIALSLIILILFTLLMVYVASKIYRVGILMRGNKATLKELWKWVRY